MTRTFYRAAGTSRPWPGSRSLSTFLGSFFFLPGASARVCVWMTAWTICPAIPALRPSTRRSASFLVELLRNQTAAQWATWFDRHTLPLKHNFLSPKIATQSCRPFRAFPVALLASNPSSRRLFLWKNPLFWTVSLLLGASCPTGSGSAI